MKYLQKKTTVNKDFLKNYEKENGRKYPDQFSDNSFVYVLCDDNLKPVKVREKQWNAEKMGWDLVETEKVYNQAQLNQLKRMGQAVEIITESDRKKLIEKQKEFEAKIKEAYDKGFADAKKSGNTE